ncbi:MAG: ABC transporter substrate-binding protein [Treponemataceae bacterium]|nr:MAG: ABC transporter substrate-binding protein [Treponemataceae bacterium]
MPLYTTTRAKIAVMSFLLSVMLILASCTKQEELADSEFALSDSVAKLLAKTVSKPWRGEAYVSGLAKSGTTMTVSILNDPKTFNFVLADIDSVTGGILRGTTDTLAAYDYIKKEFVPQAAFFKIENNTALPNGKFSVIYTLRDNLYWDFYGKPEKRQKVSADDVVFWYNEIDGDKAFNRSAYSGQFVTTSDGKVVHVDIEKIDELTFAFHFPEPHSDPILHTNMDFGPKFVFEPVKKSGGSDAVKNMFPVNCDLKTIPSMGQWFLTEYTSGQRLVYMRNPAYWDTDANGVAVPYTEKRIIRIVPDANADYLLFKNGELDFTSIRNEELQDAIENAGTKGDYTVYNAEGSHGAGMWSFNQNAQNKDKPFYEWFTQKEFRQAMSCLLNRPRIVNQVYRGLAEPKYSFFPEPNPYYNPAITLKYTYDTKKALDLLRSIGFAQDADGVMRDSKNNAIEFDVMLDSNNTQFSDIASIVADDLSKIGIKLTVRQTDFQKLVSSLTDSYDWQSVFIFLGSNIFPSQGANVWPSDTNLHLWYPLQKTPATDWEARIDELYHRGIFSIDKAEAKTVWDEYQQIILEQCPIIYLFRERSFAAVQNRWDASNIYFDNMGGLETLHSWLE